MASTYGGERRRRIAAVTALTAAGLLLWPGTAHAVDVTTTPTEARQGDAVRLEFSVPEERAGTKTNQIEVRLPADAPIAEVYPMSVNGWAPRISSRTLDKPVAGIHSSGVSTVTTAVTWVRVGESDPGPARLALSMGPMPQAERLTFEVVQTYADGTGGPVGGRRRSAPGPGAHPAAGGARRGGPGRTRRARRSGGRCASRCGQRCRTPTAARRAAPTSGSADGMLAAGLLAGLGGGAAIGWLVSRWRRRDPDEATALAEVTGGADEDQTATLAEVTGRTDTAPDPDARRFRVISVIHSGSRKPRHQRRTDTPICRNPSRS